MTLSAAADTPPPGSTGESAFPVLPRLRQRFSSTVLASSNSDLARPLPMLPRNRRAVGFDAGFCLGPDDRGACAVDALDPSSGKNLRWGDVRHLPDGGERQEAGAIAIQCPRVEDGEQDSALLSSGPESRCRGPALSGVASNRSDRHDGRPFSAASASATGGDGLNSVCESNAAQRAP